MSKNISLNTAHNLGEFRNFSRIYCINPQCKNRENPDHLDYCQNCGNSLVINSRYRLLTPLRPLATHTYTDIFEVDDGGTRKIMKVLKTSSPHLVEMFEREAFTLQLLHHPGIPTVDIDDYFSVRINDDSEELYCLVMEKIAGDNLEQWITKHGRISQTLALQWLRQLIEILQVVHENHFFHRDIKPSNIMVKPDGQLVLIDFGTARSITETYFPKLKLHNVTAVISGGYTPPEQIDGKATPQSDFYALGRTFVYLLTGKHPTELPINSKTNKLIWRDKAPQIFSPLADFIDELMEAAPAKRPLNTNTILPYLTKKGLWLKSIEILVNSFRFKLISRVLLAASITGAITYRLSFPFISQYYYDQGVKALQSNQLDAATAYFKQAKEYNSTDSRIYNNLGLVCDQKKDIVCAKNNYEIALKLNPQNPVTRYNLGGLYYDSGNLDAAELEFKLAMQSNSPVAVNAISDYAKIQILKRDTATAIKYSLEGLQKTDNSKVVEAALYKNLGWAYLLEIEYNQAEVNLQKAIELNPDRTDAYCLLAQVLEAKGDRQAVLTAWDNCLHKGNQTSVEIQIWQTMALQRLKQAQKIQDKKM